jgi:hypothetical protein
MRFAWVLVGFAVAVAACGGRALSSETAPCSGAQCTTPEVVDSGTTCKKTSDCAAGTCIFAVGDACAAQGTCYTPPAPSPINCPSVALPLACACDGTSVYVAEVPTDGCGAPYPYGYAPTPIAHFGACEGPPTPTPLPTPSPSCSLDRDCGSGEVCAFAEKDGCSAVGACIPANGGPVCNSYTPGCACDGTVVNLSCNGYPPGYEPKPILHAGACTVTGGG